MGTIKDALFVLSDVALVGIAAASWVYFLNGNDRPELHYQGRIGSEQVRFYESLWPWQRYGSVLEVKRDDGSKTVFVLKEHIKDRGFTLEKVVTSGTGGPADTNAAQEMLKQRLGAIVDQKSKYYR